MPSPANDRRQRAGLRGVQRRQRRERDDADVALVRAPAGAVAHGDADRAERRARRHAHRPAAARCARASSPARRCDQRNVTRMPRFRPRPLQLDLLADARRARCCLQALAVTGTQRSAGQPRRLRRAPARLPATPSSASTNTSAQTIVGDAKLHRDVATGQRHASSVAARRPARCKRRFSQAARAPRRSYQR